MPWGLGISDTVLQIYIYFLTHITKKGILVYGFPICVCGFDEEMIFGGIGIDKRMKMNSFKIVFADLY